MVVAPKLVLVLLTVALLAGCTSGGDAGGADGTDGTPEPPKVEATSTTGGIRGVVVDDRIVPIKGAFVEVQNMGKNLTTDEDGIFVFSGLEAGTYFIKVSHPLFAPGQVSAEVVAGESEPKALKVQLLRTVFAEPYMQTLQYEGFLVCSINLIVLLSEECGEGVGVPAQTCDLFGGPCVPIPPPGGTRVGGQSNNNAQFDFTMGAGAKTLIIEKVWEPTSEAGKAFYSPIATNWTCLPVCSGNRFAEIEGESPLYVAVDNATLDKQAIVPDTTVVSIFTWASRETTGALLNQQYTDYVSIFYYLPAPEGWSFVNGDSNPYK